MPRLTQKFGREKLLYVADAAMNITLFMRLTFIFWYEGDVRHYKFFNGENAIREMLNALKRACEKGYEAVAVTYIEADKQLEVIGFTEVGRLEKYAHMQWITRQVQRALELVTVGKTNIQLIGKKAPVIQTIGKSWICVIQFPNSDTEYTYRCRRKHTTDRETEDSFVKVWSRKENKEIVVPVLKCEEWAESKIKAEAHKLGYPDLTVIASDNVTHEEFDEWYADNVYQEDIDELKETQECFLPACDYCSMPDSNAFFFE